MNTASIDDKTPVAPAQTPEEQLKTVAREFQHECKVMGEKLERLIGHLDKVAR